MASEQYPIVLALAGRKDISVKRAILIPLTLGILGILALPQQANASYVCTTAYYPQPGALGSDGHLHVYYTSQPSCTGTFEGARYYCSPGNTSTLCHPTLEYPMEALLALYQALVSALEAQTYTINWSSSCNGGGTTCGGYVQFEAP